MITSEGQKRPRNEEMEKQILRAIEESALNSKRLVSDGDLRVAGLNDEFSTKMWLLTLQGKGLVKSDECGYVLTDKGRARLQNKI